MAGALPLRHTHPSTVWRRWAINLGFLPTEKSVYSSLHKQTLYHSLSCFENYKVGPHAVEKRCCSGVCPRSDGTTCDQCTSESQNSPQIISHHNRVIERSVSDALYSLPGFGWCFLTTACLASTPITDRCTAPAVFVRASTAPMHCFDLAWRNLENAQDLQPHMSSNAIALLAFVRDALIVAWCLLAL